MIGDFRRLISTPCVDCVIDVIAWRGEQITGHRDGWVNIGLFSHHTFADFQSWRSKLRRIPLALKGQSCPFLEFLDRDSAEQFLAALTEAVDVAFPDDVGG